MSILKCIFPCCFKNTNTIYENTIDLIDNLTEEEKCDVCKYIYSINEKNLLNSIINKKVSVKKEEYFYKEKKINKLELKNTCHYIKVINVYDADTITGILFFKGEPYIIKIRLSEIDTPEMKPNDNNIKEKALAILAKIWLCNKIENNNNILFIKTNGNEKYGRTLAHIYLSENDTNSLNNQLISLNLADSYSGKTKEKRFSKYYPPLKISEEIIYLYENKKDLTNHLNNFLKIKKF